MLGRVLWGPMLLSPIFLQCSGSENAVLYFEGRITSYTAPMLITVGESPSLRLLQLVEDAAANDAALRATLIGREVRCTSRQSIHAKETNAPVPVTCTLGDGSTQLYDVLLDTAMVRAVETKE